MTFHSQCRPKFLTSALAFAALFALTPLLHAQPRFQEEPVWTESSATPPAAFSTEALQPFEVTRDSALTYGIDPGSLIVGEDGVVRYVMVARSASGALNVLYQGIRCATAEAKTYARLSDKGGWNTSPDAAWQELSFRGPTRPAMMLARQGVCDGKAVMGNPQKILSALKTGITDRYR
ncbi:CNP1-like family protein [Hydrogenophaga sp.]|uniref:CNP1-like family protein n=1 Tax=Hydrogenophaga sp. TaxID=1904254 RepID=UPI003AF5C1B7